MLVVLGIGRFYGGILFLVDPLQRGTMHVPLSILDGMFVHDFTLPGLFLLIVMGMLPFLLAFGLGIDQYGNGRRKSLAGVRGIGLGQVR